MELGLPVGRNPPRRARSRLGLRMPARRSKFLTLKHRPCPVIVKPNFPRLKACCNRMTGGVEMLGCVLAGRAITTAHMAALRATAQVQPPSARGETFGTAIAAWLNGKVYAVSFGLHRISSGECSWSYWLQSSTANLSQ